MTISPALFPAVTVTVVRDRKIRTAQRTNQIAGFVTVPSWEKIKVYIYGLETVVSVLFSNTRTRLLYNEREIFNTARSEAECSIENSEFIVQ